MGFFRRCFWFAGGSLLLLLVARPVYAVQPQLSGDWEFTLDYGGGAYILPLAMSLEVEGENVTGTSGDETFEGTFRDGKLELSGKHYINEAGYASTLEISGVLEREQIKGNATWDGYPLVVVGKRSR